MQFKASQKLLLYTNQSPPSFTGLQDVGSSRPQFVQSFGQLNQFSLPTTGDSDMLLKIAKETLIMYDPEIEAIGEFKLFRGAVDTLKGYVQREINFNGNGKYPPSKVVSHFLFLQQMQNELFHVSSLIDPSAKAASATPTNEPYRNLNCTLDDVQIPQSFLDDDINIEFETSALGSSSSQCLDRPFGYEYRSRESLSSMYFSAPESLNGDDEIDRSFYCDNQIRDAADKSHFLHEQYSEQEIDASGTSEISVEPSPSKYGGTLKEVASCPLLESDAIAVEAEEDMPTWNNAVIVVADAKETFKDELHHENTVHQTHTVKEETKEVVKDQATEKALLPSNGIIIPDANDNAIKKEEFLLPESVYAGDDDDSIVSDTPLPKAYREPKQILDNTNDFGRISDISISATDHILLKNETGKPAETPKEEYVETPPPSPYRADNSIDAITEAMEAINIDRSMALENLESDEIITGLNEMIIPEKDVDQNHLEPSKNSSKSNPSDRLPLKDVQL